MAADEARAVDDAMRFLEVNMALAETVLAYKIKAIDQIETLLNVPAAFIPDDERKRMRDDLPTRKDDLAYHASLVYSAREFLDLQEITMNDLMTIPRQVTDELVGDFIAPPMSSGQRKSFHMFVKTVKRARGRFDPEGKMSVPMYAEDGSDPDEAAAAEGLLALAVSPAEDEEKDEEEDEEGEEDQEDGDGDRKEGALAALPDRMSYPSSGAEEKDDSGEEREEFGEEVDVEWDSQSFLNGASVGSSSSSSSSSSSALPSQSPPRGHAKRYMQTEASFKQKKKKQKTEQETKGRGFTKSFGKSRRYPRD
jgi:hypothetical protein